MQISYSAPLNQAWRRMTGLLFRPLDLGRWFVLGFTAFLAGLVEGGGAGTWSWRWQEHIDLDSRLEPLRWPGAVENALRDLLVDTTLVVVVAGLALLGLALALAASWVGSRGQFMFLDNLVHGRTEVAAPWTRFRAEGDSLFLWQVVYGLVVLVLLGGLAVGTLAVLGLLAAADASGALLLTVFVAMGTTAFVVVIVLIYVDFFLLRLVVPIMYRRRIGCTAAWAVFGQEFRRRPGSFVLYGLLHLGIGITATVVILAAGLLTCCIGLVVLAIPYVGTVLTLPLPVFARCLDLAWLGQFGPEFALPGPEAAGSGQLEGDGAVVRAEDVGQDAGGDQPGPQDP